MEVASPGALDSSPAVTMEISVCRGLDAMGAGLLICLAWGRRALVVLCPPGFCLSQRKCWILGSVPRTLCFWDCAVGFALLATQPLPHGASAGASTEMLPGLCNPLSADPLPEPLRAVPGVTQPPPHGASARAALKLLPGPAMCSPQSFRELGHRVWCALPGVQMLC